MFIARRRLTALVSFVFASVLFVCPSVFAMGEEMEIETESFRDSYSFKDLGVLPGDEYSEATAVNNRGHIVGISGQGQLNYDYQSDRYLSFLSRGFLYEEGTLRDLGIGVIPEEINDKGAVAGFIFQTPYIQAFSLYRGKLTLLPTPSGFDGARALSINIHGHAAGYAFKKVEYNDPVDGPGTDYQLRAVIWKKGNVFLLPLLENHDTSKAFEINNRAVVVGYSANRQYGATPVLWQGGKVKQVSQVAQLGIASAINSRGAIAGNYETNPDGTHAFLMNSEFEDKGALGDIVAVNSQEEILHTSRVRELEKILKMDFFNEGISNLADLSDRGRIAGTYQYRDKDVFLRRGFTFEMRQ